MKRTPGCPCAPFKALAWLMLILCAGCSAKVACKALHDPAAVATLEGLDGRSPWLKAHLPDGGLYLLSNWQVQESQRTLVGQGVRMNARRPTGVAG